MAGVKRKCDEVTYGQAFPNSMYHDPRGGRPSSLEKNILRYRAYEATLLLFYTEQLKKFMLDNVYPLAPSIQSKESLKTSTEKNTLSLILKLSKEALRKNKITLLESLAIDDLINSAPDDSKKLRRSLAHSVTLGLCTAAEAEEIQSLISYRNDIAHRMQKIMADVSRHTLAVDYAAIMKVGYRTDALDKLRKLTKLVEANAISLPSTVVSMNNLVFEFSENFYEKELIKLERIIRKQVASEGIQIDHINNQMRIASEVFCGDLDPRHPLNFEKSRKGISGYPSFTGRLNQRGVEICHKLFESGYENIVIAYLTGMSLRSIERRRVTWRKANDAGGVD